MASRAADGIGPGGVVAAGARRGGDSGGHDELVDDMALPFLDLAEKLEGCRLNGADHETWKAVLETNLFLWRFISNFLPKHFDDYVTSEMNELLERISRFMAKVGVAMDEGPDQHPELVGTVIQLNLNMCDQILAMRTDMDGSAPEAG